MFANMFHQHHLLENVITAKDKVAATLHKGLVLLLDMLVRVQLGLLQGILPSYPFLEEFIHLQQKRFRLGSG